MLSVYGSIGAAGAADFAPTKSLADVVASVRPEFEALISQAQAWGMQPKIRSAGRTCAQQNEQLKAGYSQAGLCRSMHVLGHAVDLDLMPNACSTYTKLGQWWEARGGVWGGRWTGPQFGPCGDAGHFHMGFNKAQAVPTSVCPGDLSLAECEKLRHDYLSKNLNAGAVTSKMGLVAGLLMIAAGGAFVWGVMRVKPGLKSNPDQLHHYIHVYSGGPLIIVRIPWPRPPRAALAKAYTGLMKEHGLLQKDISGLEGVVPWPGPRYAADWTDKDHALAERLRAAFSGDTTVFKEFWLYDYRDGSFQLVKQGAP